MYDEKMMIKRSTIPKAGKGVFATQDYKKYAYLGEYKGTYMTPKQFVRGNDGEYVWELTDTKDRPVGYINARDPFKSNWTRYVNCATSKRQENVIPVQDNYRMLYYAKRDISAGDELFVWYGPEYAEQLLGLKELK